MSALKIERWLLIDTAEFLTDCYPYTTQEIGAAWVCILAAAKDGSQPAPGDELTDLLWSRTRAKQRTGRTTLAPVVRAFVFERDGDVCRYCAGTEAPFEIDHIHPASRGGSDAPENLTVACEPCNRSKGAKTLAEWMASR